MENEKKAVDYEKLFNIVIGDLLRVTHSSYSLMIQGLFTGAISDEVSEHLKTCKDFHDKFRKEVVENK